MQNSPRESYRDGISFIELMDVFPTVESATQWFDEVHVWFGGRCCGLCGSIKNRPFPNAKPTPYGCTDCRGYFSVHTGTAIKRSRIPLRKWAIAICLMLASTLSEKIIH